jgi:hypothetical protein
VPFLCLLILLSLISKIFSLFSPLVYYCIDYLKERSKEKEVLLDNEVRVSPLILGKPKNYL